ncbi:MAG: TrmB family transcriptional regulator [Gammaproteobacteria bacterium]
MDIHALLQELGFSEYEARAYVSLVGDGTRNGYEVAKTSGLPRANVYYVLEKLVQRGAARRHDTRDGVRYAATPPEGLVQRLEKQHHRTLAAVRAQLAALEQTAEATPVFNIQGHDALMVQARADIDAARTTLLIAIQPNEAARLAQPLRDARERGVAITTLCMQACAVECGGCQGDIHRYCLAPGAGLRWLLLVADDKRMLAGEISATDTVAVSTEQRLIVELAASYIRQSLALATLSSELGESFHGLLSEHALQVLDALHPEGGFLARLKQVTSTTTA